MKNCKRGYRRFQERIRLIPGIVDVATDRQQGGLQASVTIDRSAAARLGVQVQDIDNALNNAFSQRQISTIFTQRNQYRVILEVDPRYQRDPSDLNRVYVGTSGGAQVPLSAVARIEKSTMPLVINHQGAFPAVTITYNITSDMPIELATNAIREAVAEIHLPDSLRTDFAGDARAFAQSVGAQPLLILAALIAVYIVLGVLYESLRTSLDDNFDTAVRRARRIARAGHVQSRIHGHRLHRNHSLDRHCEEERHHARRLRPRRRT